MKQVLTLITLMLFSVSALAQEIANCRSPKGKAFYFNLGIVQKNSAGWGDDAISGGVFTLSKKNGEFDILYLDSSKRIVSSRASGAVIQPLRKGENNFTLMVYYANDTIELYTFAKENSGVQSVHIIQSKGGDAMVQKSSILIANCDYIKFDALK